MTAGRASPAILVGLRVVVVVALFTFRRSGRGLRPMRIQTLQRRERSLHRRILLIDSVFGLFQLGGADELRHNRASARVMSAAHLDYALDGLNLLGQRYFNHALPPRRSARAVQRRPRKPSRRLRADRYISRRS